MPDRTDTNKRLPALAWIFTLYFIEGLPFSLVNTVSVALFKTLEIANSQIGLFTSLFYLPWALKLFWAPLVDWVATRRAWLIVMTSVISGLTFFLALFLYFSQNFLALCFIFALIAFASATYDIACDGFYLDVLSKEQQSLYIGWRSTAYKVAWLFASGCLVFLTGEISGLPELNKTNANAIAWSVCFFLVTFIFLLAAIIHHFYLPKLQQNALNQQDEIKEKRAIKQTFQEAFQTFFKQKNILLIVLWILTFRAGDAMLLKMAQPFCLELKEKGGLALTLQAVGLIYGSIGMLCLLLGGLLGGWLIFKLGLKKCLLPAAVLQSLTLPLYWLLAVTKPDLAWIAIANGLEQFVYGLATAMYTNYLFLLAREKFLASHYAIATGFMAFGMIIPGAISGYLADNLGYERFFLVSFFVSLPGIILTCFLPFNINQPEQVQT